MSYETAVDLLPAPSIQSNLQPVYKTPSTLLTHKVPQLPSCFSTSYFYFSNLVPMCDRARASLVSSINARIGNSKRPHPQVLKINQSHEDCSSTAVRLHKIFDPYHFRMRRSLNGRASLIGGCTVSIVDLPSVGFFGRRGHGRPTRPIDCL